MKKLCITGCLLIFAISLGHAQKSELPEMVAAYVSQIFPNEKIKNVKVENGVDGKDYNITMSGGTKLIFNQQNQPTEIECKNGIPIAGLPRIIASYVAENHPNTKIIEYEMEKEGFEVELDNGNELAFDRKGKFLKIE
jgi:hypothetical protein